MTDSGGDPCSWYINNQQACGQYDVIGEFTASVMCCACGGGVGEDGSQLGNSTVEDGSLLENEFTGALYESCFDIKSKRTS